MNKTLNALYLASRAIYHGEDGIFPFDELPSEMAWGSGKPTAKRQIKMFRDEVAEFLKEINEMVDKITMD